METVDLLLPFGLPPTEFAPDLIRQLRAPALATLLSRCPQVDETHSDPFARALPHETWLAQRLFGAAAPSLQLAGPAQRSMGLPRQAGTWFILQPANLHIARDHLVLTDLRQLRLQQDESRALFDAALPLFVEYGKSLVFGDASTWFLREDAWQTLATASPSAACGRNIDIWMPHGAGERDWRKLQNEVQMLWHTHPVNAARESRGEKIVNALWLWGGDNLDGAAQAGGLTASGEHQSPSWHYLQDPLHALLAQVTTEDDPASSIPALPDDAHKLLAVADQLISPALAGDWSEWLRVMEALEKNWFAPLLQGLRTGKIRAANLILSDATRLRLHACKPIALKKFWIKPSLNCLLK